MALHGNDPSQFTRADGCTPDNPMLKDTNSLFHNVDLSSHMPTYPVNSYSHNAQLLLKNLSHCAGRPDFCLPSSYHVLGHDNHSEDIQLGAIEQSLDFGHRSDVSTQDLYSERSQSSTGHVVRTRRRKAGGMEEARVCVVCGEPASGYNFDRLTCESCKAFFRRNALKPKEKIKACGRNGDCNIEGSQRKHCPSCRLEKCLAVGMKKELILPPEKLEQRAKPKRRKQHLASDDGDVKVGVGGGSSGGGLVPFSHSSSANPFSSSASSSSTLHHQSPRMPAPQFGGDAHELMATRTLNSLFTDMAGSRSVQSQFMSLSGFSDPQAAAAAAAVKFHLAMTSSTAANSNRLEANNANEAFDPTLHHRLPPPPTQFPSEGAFVPEASSAGPFLDGRLPRPNWQQPIPPTTTLSEVAKPLDVGLLSSRNSAIESGLPRPRQCRYQDFQTLCYHSTCRRAMLKQQRRLLQSEYLPPSLELDRPDEHLFACLTECVQRIREPFAPEEPLDTRAAETLEQEYNRMDVCIRRIIRVVKMLPYFNEIGKPAQLGLLRANVYGMIVLYSSFFFERDIRKLRYPIKRQDGTLSTVTVSMLDDLTPSMGGCIGDKALATSAFLLCKNRQAVATGLREDFELYKANTLAAFNHLDELAGEDDLLRMVLLAVKLFTDDSLSEDLRSAVELSKRAYLVFLWTYLRWRAGPKHLRQATELFARLHLAFIDLRSLEIRMTEFAKLVSLDGLSPLMREICSLRSNSSGRGLVGGAL